MTNPLNVFKSLSKVTELELEKQTLLKQLEESNNMVKNLENMSVEMSDKVKNHNEIIAKLETDNKTALETMKVDFQKQIDELKTSLIKETNSVEQKAQKIVAESIGVPMEELPKTVTQGATSVVTNILDGAIGLQGEALSSFIVQNRDAVNKALRMQKRK